MLAERLLTTITKSIITSRLVLEPIAERKMPDPQPGRKYMLYMHVPFCQVLCPYCSFNRYPFREQVARPYFENMRKEMLMLKDQGYDFESIYLGGGTPTIMLDELCETLDLARENFSIREVAAETNPNHLVQPWLDKLKGRVQRLSVGVQSFDNGLLQQMDRYKKYGSGEEILERIAKAIPYFDALNVDMIFNFPSQTEEILRSDLEKIIACGARQTTFSPLYVSNGTKAKMANSLGSIDYAREYDFYQILDETLAGGADAPFERSTLWTFTRREKGAELDDGQLTIEEFQTEYDDYPAIGSGSITHLDGQLFVNTFSLSEYNEAIESGNMSLMGRLKLSRKDMMRYCFLVNLYKLRFDKQAFKKQFGVSVERALAIELAFMRLNGAFATDNDEELTLTPKGRYLVVVMYREFLSGMNNLREQARAALTGADRELLFEDSNPF